MKAQGIIRVDPLQEKQTISLASQVLVWADSASLFTNPLQLDESLFSRYDSNTSTFQTSPGADLWLKFILKSDQEHLLPWYLEIQNPRDGYLSYFNQQLEDIQLFYQKNGQWQKVQTGNAYPKTWFLFKNKHFLIPLNLEKGPSQAFYLKIKSSTFGDIPIHIISSPALSQNHRFLQVWYGVFIGILGASIIASFFIYLAIRRRGYLILSFYTLAALIFNLIISGNLKRVFGLDFGHFAGNLGIISYGVLLTLAALFAIYFLNLKKTVPILYKLMYGQIFFAFCLLLSGIFYPQPFTLKILDLNALIMLFMGIIASYLVYKQGNKAAKYYQIAYLLYFIFAGLDILNNLGHIPGSSFIEHGSEIGVTFECFFLLIGLSSKYRYEKRRYHSRLQKVQEEKLKLELQNREKLERLVAERTYELDQTVEELNQNNDILLQQTEALKQLNDTKDKFFSILGHDLRGPLSSLIGFSDLLKDEVLINDLDTIQKMGAEMHSASKNVLDLLNNLLNWALSQTNGIETTIEAQDLHHLVARNIEILGSLAQEKNIQLKLESSSSHWAYLDTDTVNTILRNLISNAIKFSQEGQKIKISIQDDEEYWQVCIKDQGIGMSQEQIDNLFRVDIKQSRPGTQKEKGTGLGLILVKEFVELNQGDIKVHSETNQGSSFCFTLPKASPQESLKTV